MTKYNLTFINEVDFENHILETILQYQKSIQSFDLNKFLKNKIDPIKLLFDSVIYNNKLEETIKQEINRQKDKTNNNIIGYFHQNIFKYIKNCYVPEKGWDVIFTHPKTKIKYYIEIKNKHNTRTLLMLNSFIIKCKYITRKILMVFLYWLKLFLCTVLIKNE
ncbi:Eco47II family restriction endonuclease [Mycoplasmopsis felis]|uniref:Eco47II family restriction endonuclease n=1 Tax=Mycoplasmopsis felis TaxID=33923 RepID=UPI002AFE98FC|nr:Eco47II family restriction endonuclease [Mycoplasmopsis felis]WQQ04800.1 Eco47II family restriction endonuclease [Mycoplasmopsis felis]